MVVPHCTQLDRERIATSTRESKPGVLVVSKHHLLVRCSHWLNVPILLGLRAAAATSRAGQDLIATLPPYPELQRPRLLINLKPVHAVPRPVQNLGEFPFRQPCESSSPVHIPAQGQMFFVFCAGSYFYAGAAGARVQQVVANDRTLSTITT